MIIERRLHFVWIGGTPMPEPAKSWVDEWIRLHPGYESIIWDDDRVYDTFLAPKAKTPMLNRDVFEQMPHHSQKSDCLRYEILYRYGGLYVDTDIQCFKCVEPLINDAALVTSMSPYDNSLYETCFLGAKANHPAIRRVIDFLPFYFHHYKDRSDLWASGPYCFQDILQNYPGLKLLPKEHVHRFPMWFMSGQLEKRAQLAKHLGSYALHHGLGSWITGNTNLSYHV